MYLLRLCIIKVIVLSLNVVVGNPENPEITAYEFENDGLGRSKFRYALNDGTSNEQDINALSTDTEKDQLFSKGSYSYQKDGIVTMVTYEADHNGFRPHVTIYNIFKQELHFPTSGIATLQGGGIG